MWGRHSLITMLVFLWVLANPMFLPLWRSSREVRLASGKRPRATFSLELPTKLFFTGQISEVSIIL